MNPWDTAKLMFRNKSGSVEQWDTDRGSVDVYDPRKSDGNDTPVWALYIEVDQVSRAFPELSQEEMIAVARIIERARARSLR